MDKSNKLDRNPQNAGDSLYDRSVVTAKRDGLLFWSFQFGEKKKIAKLTGLPYAKACNLIGVRLIFNSFRIITGFMFLKKTGEVLTYDIK